MAASWICVVAPYTGEKWRGCGWSWWRNWMRWHWHSHREPLLVWARLAEWGRMLWYGDEITAAIEAHNQRLLTEAADQAVKYTRRMLSRPGVSAPGEYPGMDTGALAASVYAGIDRSTK